MKRRSKAGGEPFKGRRQKAAKPTLRNAPKVPALPNSFSAVEEAKFAQLTRELSEALEREAATSEVLQVIRGSPGDLQPVFQAMLKNAVRLCDASFGSLYRWDGDALHLIATHNTPPAFAEYRKHTPLRPGPTSASGRMVVTKTAFTSPTLQRSGPTLNEMIHLMLQPSNLAVHGRLWPSQC
jgi:hypothetical protein